MPATARVPHVPRRRLTLHRQSELTHRLASCLLGGAAVFVIGLIGREVFDERVGLLAAAGAVVYAHLWINDEMLMSESAYVLTSGSWCCGR